LRFSLSHWVQESPLPPAAQAIIIFFATFLIVLTSSRQSSDAHALGQQLQSAPRRRVTLPPVSAANRARSEAVCDSIDKVGQG
jgi:hypothetical protein